jgi:hypothetical protein
LKSLATVVGTPTLKIGHFKRLEFRQNIKFKLKHALPRILSGRFKTHEERETSNKIQIAE